MSNQDYIKPKWLVDLESQSWQTEMVASGLAIVGSLALGPLLISFSENLIPYFSDHTLRNLEAVFTYLFNAQTIMVMCFIMHLSLRILWAGFLGLSSVYPRGINSEKKIIYAESLIKQVKKEFPDLSAYSIKLDKVCSIIFSIICALLMLLVSIAVWITLFIVVSNLLREWLNPEVYTLIGKLFAVLALGFLIFALLITTGPLKNNSWAKKFAYPTNQIMSKILFLISYEPISYIMWTLRTNSNMGKFFMVPTLFIMIVAFLTVTYYKPYLDNFSPHDYYYVNHDSHENKFYNYDDELDKTRRLAISIQSRVIKENHLEIFIPILKREQLFRDKICGETPHDKKLNKRQRKLNRAKYLTECAPNAYTISIDSTTYQKIEYTYSKHANRQEEGFRAYLDIEQLAKGNHILKIQTLYSFEDEKPAIRHIPFYKSH